MKCYVFFFFFYSLLLLLYFVVVVVDVVVGRTLKGARTDRVRLDACTLRRARDNASK